MNYPRRTALQLHWNYCRATGDIAPAHRTDFQQGIQIWLLSAFALAHLRVYNIYQVRVLG
ncbi:hypothetical protein H6F88_26365 [Oculatella sp. FACHB-28]|uniref:hypothetical protein n=1 Tax=Oculatella sp. FACHB-28 TaxID=2692845 RepID=UPI00168435C4|nr:hypothetical protein [Oculatella sp. FACHB-28]MBD2059478.1 hypothetical protein [Oculatella sp. FACHB-28]